MAINDFLVAAEEVRALAPEDIDDDQRHRLLAAANSVIGFLYGLESHDDARNAKRVREENEALDRMEREGKLVKVDRKWRLKP